MLENSSYPRPQLFFFHKKTKMYICTPEIVPIHDLNFFPSTKVVLSLAEAVVPNSELNSHDYFALYCRILQDVSNGKINHAYIKKW